MEIRGWAQEQRQRNVLAEVGDCIAGRLMVRVEPSEFGQCSDPLLGEVRTDFAARIVLRVHSQTRVIAGGVNRGEDAKELLVRVQDDVALLLCATDAGER